MTCRLITLRDKRQLECYEKARNKNSFLIAAICRFGKTYVASKLLHDAWNANIAVVLSGINVRDEWKNALIEAGFDNVITTNQELNMLDLNNLDHSKKYVFFVSSQKAGMGLIKRDPTVIPSNIQLIEAFNSFPGTKVICFDESHFAEQTERSQLLLSQYKVDKKLYISGTPYTTSLVKQFPIEDRFQYTYIDLKQDWDNGALPYRPVLLNMYILDKFISLDEENCVEDWPALFRDTEKTTCLLTRTLKFAIENNNHNNLIVCNRTKDASAIVNLLNSKHFRSYNVRAISAAGTSDRIDSTEATEFFLKDNDTFNFIVTCDRLCTGATIPPLQSVMFYCPTQSAIKFIQTSMRCCSPWEGHNKEHGSVVCFNNFGAFSIYATIANLEINDKATTRTRQDDFNTLQSALPLFIEDSLGLRKVEFAEATNFEALYVHGKTKFFTDFSDLSEFTFFNFNKSSLKELATKIAKATGKNYEDVKQKLEKANEKGGVEAVNAEYNELMCIPENVKSVEQQEIDQLEKARANLQKAFTCIVETCVLNNWINTDYEINYTAVEPAILDIGFCSTDKFKELAELHPEYIRCIVNYCKIQLTNLGV